MLLLAIVEKFVLVVSVSRAGFYVHNKRKLNIRFFGFCVKHSKSLMCNMYVY